MSVHGTQDYTRTSFARLSCGRVSVDVHYNHVSTRSPWGSWAPASTNLVSCALIVPLTSIYAHVASNPYSLCVVSLFTGSYVSLHFLSNWSVTDGTLHNHAPVIMLPRLYSCIMRWEVETVEGFRTHSLTIQVSSTS